MQQHQPWAWQHDTHGPRAIVQYQSASSAAQAHPCYRRSRDALACRSEEVLYVQVCVFSRWGHRARWCSNLSLVTLRESLVKERGSRAPSHSRVSRKKEKLLLRSPPRTGVRYSGQLGRSRVLFVIGQESGGLGPRSGPNPASPDATQPSFLRNRALVVTMIAAPPPFSSLNWHTGHDRKLVIPLILLALLSLPAVHAHDHQVITEEMANAPVDAMLWIHIFLQASVWGIIFPIGMVLGLSRSRWHVPLQVCPDRRFFRSSSSLKVNNRPRASRSHLLVTSSGTRTAAGSSPRAHMARSQSSSSYR
jgi:hypothetical protein